MFLFLKGVTIDSAWKRVLFDRGNPSCLVFGKEGGGERCAIDRCVVVCCSVLQCVAVSCSVLQCVAVYCSVLQLRDVQ